MYKKQKEQITSFLNKNPKALKELQNLKSEKKREFNKEDKINECRGCKNLTSDNACLIGTLYGIERCIKTPKNINIIKPIIICICGSTKFTDLHAIKKWELEKEGEAICLMINYLPFWYAEEQGWIGQDHFAEQEGNKEILDELHLRKIDLADKIYVIDKGGYIGESTRKEIEYAENLGKPILYLEKVT